MAYPDTLIIHPDDEDVAKSVLNSQLLIGYGGGDNTTTPNINTNFATITRIISRPELASGQFFLLDNRGNGFKPWVFNQPYGGYKWDAEGSREDKFNRDIYRFGLMYHFGISATRFWHRWYGSYSTTWPTYTDPETSTG